MLLGHAFNPLEHYRPAASPYRLLPFRFMRWTDDSVLVVNDVGQYCFLGAADFAEFVRGQLVPSVECYDELRSRHFLSDSSSTTPLQLLATKYRTRMAHLAGFTKLHMFVVTLRCDHSCRYCQVSRVTSDRAKFDMTLEIARKAIDHVFRSPAERLKIEFQGGEPLLNFELVASIVELAQERNVRERRKLEFVVATNLVPLTTTMLEFMAAHGMFVSTSLDGPAFLHDANRPRPGSNSHELVAEKISLVRERLGRDQISAIMTTTERSLDHPREIIDEYIRLGFDAVFLRPISPYGFAVRTGEAASYQTERFLRFYREGLEYVIQLNRGGLPMLEIYAQIVLRKILTPFATGYVDLQTPAGTVLGAVAYNYDGRVYASDEARMLAAMGDDSFCLGNVEEDYEALFGGEIAQALAAGSVMESLPGCSDCAFLPFCGADPVFHYRTQGDVVGRKPTSAFCQKNMAIIRLLLSLLKDGDDFTRQLLTSWGTGIPAVP